MKVLYLANGLTGLNVARFLAQRGDKVVGAVVHPEHEQRLASEIVDALALPKERVFTGDRLREPDVRAAMMSLGADMALSVLFDYILHPEFISLFPAGVVNLHPSYLPWNRGQYPNVWSIVEGTPAGVTLHFIDEGIDTGDIIAQREVQVSWTDTGETLYRKLEQEMLACFQETWPILVSGKAPRIPQPKEQGTYHRTNDVKRIDPINLDADYKARDLINILRARSFSPYAGAYFTVDGHKVYMRLELYEKHDDEF